MLTGEPVRIARHTNLLAEDTSDTIFHDLSESSRAVELPDRPQTQIVEQVGCVRSKIRTQRGYDGVPAILRVETPFH